MSEREIIILIVLALVIATFIMGVKWLKMFADITNIVGEKVEQKVKLKMEIYESKRSNKEI